MTVSDGKGIYDTSNIEFFLLSYSSQAQSFQSREKIASLSFFFFLYECTNGK